MAKVGSGWALRRASSVSSAVHQEVLAAPRLLLNSLKDRAM